MCAKKILIIGIISACVLVAISFVLGCGDAIEVETIPFQETRERTQDAEPQVLSFLNEEEGWGGTIQSHYGGISTPNRDERTSKPIFHYINGTWHEVRFKDDFGVYGICTLKNDDIWAIGHEIVEIKPSGKKGLILHFDGESWTKTTYPSDYRLRALSLVARDDGWSVGTGGVSLHFDGESWELKGGPKDSQLLDCDMPARGDCWAVGNGIYHYSNGEWKQLPLDREYFLNSISMLTKDEGWAVGEGGAILHYDGESWKEHQSPVSEGLSSVDMVSSNGGWAVGNNGSILKYDGATWSVYEVVPNSQLSAVAAISENECWIAGIREERDIVSHIKE